MRKTSDDAKDLKDLRTAYGALSRPINRLIVVRLTALAILVFSFGRAFDRLERSDATARREQLEKVAEANRGDTDPTARREYERLWVELEANSEKAFTVKLPIPETEVEVDLRYWIYALPFALIVSQLVLVQLARRQRLLAALAARRVASLGAVKPTSVDRLMFPAGDGGASEFLRFPSALLRALEKATVIILVGYLVHIGRPLWRQWNTGAVLAAVAALVATVFYAIAYDALARARQEAAVAAITSQPPPVSRRARAWSAFAALAIRLVRRLRPTLSLSAGSVLVLVTLILPLCVTHCGEPMRGADLVRGYGYLGGDDEVPLFSKPPASPAARKDVMWFGLANGAPGLARAVYLVALALGAAAPIVLVLRSRRPFPRPRLLGVCRAASMVLWLFVLNDCFASSFVLAVVILKQSGGGEAELLGTLAKLEDGALLYPMLAVAAAFFGVSTALWARAWRADLGDGDSRWPVLRRRLAVALVPHAVYGTAFVVAAAIAFGLPGLACYFVGVSLLALGFAAVHDEARGTPPPWASGLSPANPPTPSRAAGEPTPLGAERH